MEYQLCNNLLNNDSDSYEYETKNMMQDLYDLWHTCFEDSKEYMDFYFKWKTLDNRVLSIYKHGQISSMLHLNPYIINAKNKQIPSNYIVGVATKKEERRKGLMKCLLETSIQQMYQEEMPFTYLMPALESIYLPYDFTTVYYKKNWNQLLLNEYKKIQVSAEKERTDEQIGEIEGAMRDIKVIALESSNLEQIEALVQYTNQILSKNYDIFVHRTTYYYQRLIHEMRSTGGNVVLFYQHNSLIGYLSYMAEEEIYITECICSPNRMEEVLQALLVKDTIVKGLMSNMNKDRKTDSIPSIMFRIVNLTTFVKNITSTKELSICIKVHDSIVNENNGVFQMTFTPDEGVLSLTSKEPELILTISDVIKLFFHVYDENELRNLIQSDKKDECMRKLKCINGYNKIFINDVV